MGWRWIERSYFGKSADCPKTFDQDCSKLVSCIKGPDRCDAEGHSCRCCFIVDPKGNPGQAHDHDGWDVRLRYEKT